MKNTTRKSAAQHAFSLLPTTDIERSTFDRSHGHKTMMNGGDLVPVFIDEVVPSDEFALNLNYLGRMITPITPFMDNVHASFHFFYVPKRLVWDNFEKFICGTADSNGNAYTYPTMWISKNEKTYGASDDNAYYGLYNGSLADHFGIPFTDIPDCDSTKKDTGLEINSLPFRAYNLIWNEWYRQEQIQDKVNVYTGDSNCLLEKGGDYKLLKRGKRHDYFTSCLPSPQLGEEVLLPLGATAPVIGNGKAIGLTDGTNACGLWSGSYLLGATNAWNQDVGETVSAAGDTLVAHKAIGLTKLGEYSGMVADLSNATSASINSIREAFQIQRLFERDARCGGERYVEFLLAHFKTTSPDARLQRPEYLGGFTHDMLVNAIAQTSASEDGSTPQGNLAATVQGFGNGGFKHSFVEHGYIIGLASITTDLTYQQGLDKLWTRRKRFDEYFPVFAHLGEQPVLEGEIYSQGKYLTTPIGGLIQTYDAYENAETDTNITDSSVFGYQERYAEYRYKPSMITSGFRSGLGSESFDIWHLAQEFESAPTLSSEFIQETPPFERVLAVDTDTSPQFMLDMWFDLKCTRPLPMYGVPGMVDHF